MQGLLRDVVIYLAYQLAAEGDSIEHLLVTGGKAHPAGLNAVCHFISILVTGELLISLAECYIGLLSCIRRICR